MLKWIALLSMLAAPQSADDESRPPSPKGNPSMWVTDADYPPAARRAGESGRVKFSLLIDAQGQVRGCRIVESSGSALLDEATCRVMTRRAVFHPAQDATGAATEGNWSNEMRWSTPRK